MSFGRLDPQPGGQPMSDINMTPLIDVMLVLLVIFIITAPLLGSAIRLDLPQAGGASSRASPRAVQVSVDAQGRVYLADQPVDLALLAVALRDTARARPDTEVQLRADQAVAYAKVLAIIGLAQQAGLTRIGFVSQPPAAALAQGQP